MQWLERVVGKVQDYLWQKKARMLEKKAAELREYAPYWVIVRRSDIGNCILVTDPRKNLGFVVTETVLSRGKHVEYFKQALEMLNGA